MSLKKIVFLLLFCVLFSSIAQSTQNTLSTSAVSPSYKLSICAIFKNEAPYLKEWIEYHKLVGVEHFYLYNNESDDHYRDVLSPYIETGEVTLIDWPNRATSEWGNKIWAWVFSTQVSAYEHAFQMAKDASQWIAAIDIDEFIVPIKANTIPQILEKYGKHFPGIHVYWRIYGTSDVDDVPSGQLMIETLNKKSYAGAPCNQSYKSILKPTLYKNFHWPPHHCVYRDGSHPYFTDPSEIVINHYMNRTNRYFYSQKIKNKEQMDNVKYSPQQIADMQKLGNDLVDTERAIHRFVPALRQKMGLPLANDVGNASCYSFDVFDTLLGRLHFHPDSIFDRVEQAYPFPNFKDLRKAAEKFSNGTLPDIYQKFKGLAKLSDAEASKLMEFEIQTEMSEIFPISENMRLVKDGDVIISDSYYSKAQIAQLLNKAGLNKRVAIHAYPAGKSSGSIWEKAKREKWGIALHIGDNQHSDVAMAEKHAIAAKHYLNSQLSRLEQQAEQLGKPQLAYLMRALRLQNPYPLPSPEHALWNEQAQLNIPILIECCLYLDAFCKTHQKKRVLFSSRGCCHWKALFEKLFPHYESIYFHTSRHVYLHPSSDYIDYVQTVYTSDSVIVDEHGSGDSCLQFFKQHFQCQPTYLAIVNVDLAQFRNAPQEILALPRYGIVKTSGIFSNNIEMFNYDLIGTLQDFQKGKTIRMTPEYDLKFVQPAHACMQKCLALLPHYSFGEYQPHLLRALLKALDAQVVTPRYVNHVRYHFDD